jgi:hypothetical protein
VLILIGATCGQSTSPGAMQRDVRLTSAVQLLRLSMVESRTQATTQVLKRLCVFVICMDLVFQLPVRSCLFILLLIVTRCLSFALITSLRIYRGYVFGILTMANLIT